MTHFKGQIEASFEPRFGPFICPPIRSYKALDLLRRISPAAWQHIHFLGHYAFRDKRNPIDFPRCQISVQQSRQEHRVVGNYHIGNQPATLVADVHVQVGTPGQFLLSVDLGDGGAQLVVGLNAVFRAVDITICAQSTVRCAPTEPGVRWSTMVILPTRWMCALTSAPSTKSPIR